MKIKTGLIFPAIIAVSILACGNEPTQQTVTNTPDPVNNAKIVMYIGDVQVMNAGQWSKATPNMKVSQGDEVKTGSKSQCNLQIGSDSFVAIKSNSQIKIDTLARDINGAEQTAIELKLGKSVINPKKLMKDESFNVTTPTAVAGVRGTKFVVENTPGAKLRVSVIEGKVELKKRIPALENIDQSIIQNTPEIAELNDKINNDVVMIEENQSASVDNKNAEKLNNAVSAALEEIAKTEPVVATTQTITTDNQVTDTSDATEKKEVKIELSKAIKNELKTVMVSEKKSEARIKVEEVVPEAKVEVEEFTQEIDAYKIKDTPVSTTDSTVTEPVTVSPAELVITTPVKNAKIYINNRYMGKGDVKIQPKDNKPMAIKVEADGFERYALEMTLNPGEKKSLNVELTKIKKNSRISWNLSAGKQILGNMVESDGLIFAGTEDGKLVCITDNGSKKWSADLERRIESTPVIYGKNIYVVSNSMNLYSINKFDGSINWKKKLFGSLLFNSKPLIADNKIYVATSFGRVYAMDMNGKEVWQKDLQTGVYSTPAIAEGLLIIGSDDHKLTAFSVTDGEIKWQSKLDNRIVGSSPIIANKKIFIGSYSGKVLAFDLMTGKEAWLFKTGDIIMSSPVLNEGVIYIGSNDGNLYAISADNGSLKWKFAAESKITSTPSINQGVVYISSGKQVYAVDLISGKLQWSQGLNSEIKTSVTLDNNNLYVGDESGSVTALRADLRQVVR